MGLEIGANAETDLYMPGYLRKSVRAPCPPMEWPEIETREESREGKVEKRSSGSSEVM